MSSAVTDRHPEAVDAPDVPEVRRGVRIVLGILVALVVAIGAGLAAVDLRIANAVLALVALVLVVCAIALSRRNVQTVLTLVVVLLLLLPAPYVLVGPLRSVGNPALLAGLIATALWLGARISGTIPARPLHPVRWLILLFALTSLTAYAAGMNRILSLAEDAGATRTLFPLVATIGIGLLAVDGLREVDQVEVVLRRLIWVAGLAALGGILEFTLPGFSYRDFARLPGLTTTTDLISDTRSGFDRIQGAASHPIEYVVTLTALIPIALHFTLHSPTRPQRQLSGLALLLILMVSPMSVARSGIVALAVGLLVYAAHLSNRARLNLLVLGLIGLGVYRVMVPGLLGTLRSLLLVGEDDPSIRGRTLDYAKIPGLMEGYEVFGRGLGTFQPLTYFYLDNQYLGSLLEGGVVGFVCLILLFVVGIGVARGVRHRTGDPALRGMAQALAASIAALAVCAATFDELGFRQPTFVLFLLLGCAGALWTVVRDQPLRHWSGELRAPELASVGGSRPG